MYNAQKKQHVKQKEQFIIDDNALSVLRQKAKKLTKTELLLWLGDEKLKLERIALKEYGRYGRLTTEKCLYQSKKVDMMLNLIENVYK